MIKPESKEDTVQIESADKIELRVRSSRKIRSGVKGGCQRGCTGNTRIKFDP